MVWWPGSNSTRRMPAGVGMATAELDVPKSMAQKDGVLLMADRANEGRGL